MLAVGIDVIGIIIGSVLGILLGKKLNSRMKSVIEDALGVSVLCIGVLDLIKTQNVLLLLLSLIFGGVYGTIIGINRNLERFTCFLSQKLSRLSKKGQRSKEESMLKAQAIVNAAMLYSVGAMVIYGSIRAGLGDPSTMYIKTALDFITALVFCVKGGFSVVFAALPVFIIETVLCLTAQALSPYITAAFINQLSGTGGALMIIIGLNQLRLKKMPPADYLPAILGSLFIYLL